MTLLIGAEAALRDATAFHFGSSCRLARTQRLL